MATEPRLETLLDVPTTLVQGSRNRPLVQLPPLHDRIPPRQTLRPLALEPAAVAVGLANTSVSKLSPAQAVVGSKVLHQSEKGETLKLKAHYEAEVGSMSSSSNLFANVVTGNDLGSNQNSYHEERKSGPTVKKRQKLNGPTPSRRHTAQLPRPSREERKAVQIPKIAALNDCRTPSPNTTCFPPITLLPLDAPKGDSYEHAPGNDQNLPIQVVPWSGAHPTTARACKPRRKWTKEETENLLQGVSLHGVGNWKKILEDEKFTFNARSAIDLKDRSVLIMIISI